MNKQVSAQYAYKKDGKGERHGDEAERMLAAQARKHNVRPPTQQAPSAFPGAGPGAAPPTMSNGDGSRPVSTVHQASDPGISRTMPMGYQSVPPPQSRPSPSPSSLTTPPPGLPARPPPSQAGYGGPQAFLPPGFSGTGQQPSFAPQSAPPPGFAPPGFGPPTGAAGAPPPLPPGFQQPGYGGGRWAPSVWSAWSHFLALIPSSTYYLPTLHSGSWGVRSNDPQKNESVKNVPDTLMECFCAFRLMAIRLHLYPRITGRGNEASTDRWIYCRMAIDYTWSAFPTQLFYLIVERIA